MRKRGCIGIDIGGTKTLFALFDDRFDVVEEIKVRTQADKGEEHFTQTLTEAVEALAEKADRKGLALVSLGIGCAGTLAPDRGTLRTSPNIPFLSNYPFRTKLTKLTGASVTLANDVQAGLYGEHQLGAAIGCKNVLGIFLGTGIGGAIIIDGKPYLGTGGHAGDIGHYMLQPLGPLAGSERQGVLDDLVGRTAIAGGAASLAAKQWAPHLLKAVGTDVSKIRSGDLAEAIENGDTAIEELVRSRARIVGIALSNMVDFLNPEMIVLGGGITEAMPDLIRQEVQTGIDEHATEQAREGLTVVVAKLRDHAVTTGAAKLALDQFLSAQPAAEPAPSRPADAARPS